MKKKDIIILCLIALAIFLFNILLGVELPLIIIGIFGFFLYFWADSKEKDEITKRTLGEVKKMLDEQSIEKTIQESEEKDNAK